MTVPVRGNVPRAWNDGTAQHISERLQRLEKELSGGTAIHQAPSVPSFGGSSPSSPPSGGGSGGSGGGGGGGAGVTDHAALTGLEENDHPQYLLHEEQALSQPHTHTREELHGLEAEFVLRGEGDRPHTHALDDLADYDEWEMLLMRRVMAGVYGG